MSSSYAIPQYHDVDGFRIPKFFSPDCFRQALRYSPTPEDIFVPTFAKCGTTWTQQLLYLITHNGQPPTDHMDFQLSMPFIEFYGPDSVTNMRRPGGIKTHLPFHLVPFSPEAKYIYVARNPKDCCVSFYYHTKLFPGYEFVNGTFDTFFDVFIAGQTDWGDFFDHLLGWYAHRHDPNVLFLTYESMKADLPANVLKICKFLGSKYAHIQADSEIMKNILNYSSVSYMKKAIGEPFEELLSTPPEELLSAPGLPQGMRYMMNYMKNLNIKAENTSSSGAGFVRKGIVGDWKEHFSEEQNRRMLEWIKQKTQNSDVMDLWKDLGYF